MGGLSQLSLTTFRSSLARHATNRDGQERRGASPLNPPRNILHMRSRSRPVVSLSPPFTWIQFGRGRRLHGHGHGQVVLAGWAARRQRAGMAVGFRNGGLFVVRFRPPAALHAASLRRWLEGPPRPAEPASERAHAWRRLAAAWWLSDNAAPARDCLFAWAHVLFKICWCHYVRLLRLKTENWIYKPNRNCVVFIFF